MVCLWVCLVVSVSYLINEILHHTEPPKKKRKSEEWRI